MQQRPKPPSDVSERRVKTVPDDNLSKDKKIWILYFYCFGNTVTVCVLVWLGEKSGSSRYRFHRERICHFNLSRAFIFMRLWSGSVAVALSHYAPAIRSSFCLSNCGQCFKQNVGICHMFTNNENSWVLCKFRPKPNHRHWHIRTDTGLDWVSEWVSENVKLGSVLIFIGNLCLDLYYNKYFLAGSTHSIVMLTRLISSLTSLFVKWKWETECERTNERTSNRKCVYVFFQEN